MTIFIEKGLKRSFEILCKPENMSYTNFLSILANAHKQRDKELAIACKKEEA